MSIRAKLSIIIVALMALSVIITGVFSYLTSSDTRHKMKMKPNKPIKYLS